MRSIARIGVVTLVVAVALASVSSTAFAKGKKPKGTRPTVGKVTAVDQNSITVQTKKQRSKQFTLTTATVYERASKASTKPATLADVKANRQVKIVAAGGQAQKVTVSARKAKAPGKQGKKHKARR